MSQPHVPSCRTAPVVACLWGLTGGIEQKCQACIFRAAVSATPKPRLLRSRKKKIPKKTKSTLPFLDALKLSFALHRSVFNQSLGQSRQRPRALAYPPPCLGPWIRADSHYRRRWLLKCVLCNSLSATAAFLQRASRAAGESQTQPHHCEILKRFPDHTAPRATSSCWETDHMDHLVKYTEFFPLKNNLWTRCLVLASSENYKKMRRGVLADLFSTLKCYTKRTF